MRTGWVMGWAVPESWFAAQVKAVYPEGEHVFFEPTDSVLAELAARGPFDRVAGYSLGAYLLLAEARRVSELAAQVVLLAPFLSFPAEEELGGRVARTQVRYLARWVRREREAALMDFYTKAGLDVSAQMASGISEKTLQEGLGHLEKGRVEPAVPAAWRMYAGERDGLLDATGLGRHMQSLVVVAGATHHPAALLRAWKEDGV